MAISLVRAITLFLFLAALLDAQGSLRLKNSQGSASRIRPRTSGRSHFVVETGGVGREELARLLERRNARIVRSLAGSGYVISAPESADLRGIGLVSAVPMDAASKVSVDLINGGLVNFFLVEFHPDVAEADEQSLVSQNRLILHLRPDMPANQLLIEGSLDNAEKLAESDEVAYLFPASEDLINGLPVYPCSSTLTLTGSIGQYIATVGDGWDGAGKGAAALTYSYQALTEKLTRTQVTTQIERALAEWSKAASVTFTLSDRTDGAKNLNFLFASGSHGDAYPFDGPGKVLAHTYFPPPTNTDPIAGDLHFDADESWQIGADIDLFSVVLHELGHSLGLGHSDTPGAVMYPYYQRASKLMAADIAAIQTLYAAGPDQSEPTPVPGSGGSTPGPSGTPSEPGAAPLTISVPDRMLTSLASADLYGTTSGGYGEIRVTWSSDKGTSGQADGIRGWHLVAAGLVAGINTITVTATDEAGTRAAGAVMVTRSADAGNPGPTPAPTPTPTPTPPTPTPGPTPSPSPVYIVINAPPRSNVTQMQFAATGTATSAGGIARVKWVNSKGGSGIATGTVSWSANIALQAGDNSITVTAVATNGTEASQTVVVAYTAGTSRDVTAPGLTITNPSTTSVSISRTTITVAGTAQDNAGVVEVSWENSTGPSGIANGTANWSTGEIPLLVGDNRITIRAKDAAGNMGWRALVVTRR